MSILVLRVAVNHTIAQISFAELAVIVWFWCYGFYGCGFIVVGLEVLYRGVVLLSL